MKYKYPTYLLLLLSLVAFNSYAKESFSVEVLDEELSIDRYEAEGDQLVIFITTGYGMAERIESISTEAARLGVEFWTIDLVESLFLPRATSTVRAMDGSYVAGLIAKAHEVTGKQVTIMTRAYTSIPVLRGVRKWQQQQKSARIKSANSTDNSAKESIYLNGVILLSPELYIKVPDLGLDPVFAPIASASNIPIMFYQSGNRGNRWQMDRVVAELQKGGALVFTKLFPGVTGIFYEDDNAPQTIKLLKELPREIVRANKLLLRTPTPLDVAPLTVQQGMKESRLDSSLRPFKGNPVPPPLDLITARGERAIHSDYRGKLTLVNFWASWCRPCVEEIPSLNRLRKKMKGTSFELISVDYAEDKETIDAFMKDVDVDFPVLLDTDGRVSSQWGVVVFPSTFIIAADGKIVYGVKGAVHWDAPEIVEKLKALVSKELQ